MKYLLLIYEQEARYETMSAEDQGAIIERYMKLGQDLQESGAMLGGDALQPVATASTVRVRDGRTMVTDGPFAETKEQLGGYYLIEAEDLDQAMGIAARIPGAESGCVEVRPIMTFD